MFILSLVDSATKQEVTSSNLKAEIGPVRIYVPSYIRDGCIYTIATDTWMPGSDDYFLRGYADDAIYDVRLGVGELWNDWQWSTGDYGIIYRWSDGFCYPLGYFSEQQDCWKQVQFKFDNEKGSGCLEFRYLSYTNDKDQIGLPEVYAWCDAWVTDPGRSYDVIVGNATIVERKYFVGSSWASESTPGLSKRSITTSQEISIYDNIWDHHEKLRLGFGIAHLTPKFSETAQCGIMLNLTHISSDGDQDPYEFLRLEDVKLDIYTPPQSVSIAGLVFRDPNDPNSDVIVESGGRIAVAATAAIANWEVGIMGASGMLGPAGIMVALGGLAAGHAMYDYAAGYQEENFGETPGGNSTHRQIWYDYMLGVDTTKTPPESKSHIVFVGLNKVLPKSCGAIKLVLHGTIDIYDVRAISIISKVAFEMGIVVPIFAW
jgi:hypothetical protein